MFNKIKQTNMNKKIYMIPTLEVVKIQAGQQVLTSSPGYGGATTETSGNMARELDEFFE